MKILVLNCGGSSFKYQLLDMTTETVLARGSLDRMGTDEATLVHRVGDEIRFRGPTDVRDFTDGIRFVVDRLIKDGVVSGMSDINAVAHKLAHGGELFSGTVLIDDEVLEALRKLAPLAPVHNPPNVRGIEVCRHLLPGIPQVGSFETAFHRTVPAKAYTYGVPHEWYERFGVRKYGFHGASHSYVAQRAAQIVGRPAEELRTVSCHLGSGTSVAAIAYGRSVDISSGFTPQSGTIMSTRPGDFDPWVIPYMAEQTGMDNDTLSRELVTRGGLLGISGLSGDMRDLEEAAEQGDERAHLAVEVFCYQVKKYIGAFTAVMNGLDCLVFTGGIGENSASIRARIAGGLESFGVYLDVRANSALSGEGVVSTPDSRVKVAVIKADEELVVARQAAALLRSSHS
ncbi:MAG: acetate/propionate family kinase [Limnochordia bacterium]|jgi:acetate kinase|nr:acetate kinase [Bacteroidales bacterium]